MMAVEKDFEINWEKLIDNMAITSNLLNELPK